jgi:hypothetical protein
MIWIAVPDWMRSVGVDIRIVGLVTLAHAPWTFKMLWSPFMDRYPVPWLGRRRGWIAICQIALTVLTLALAGVAQHPDAPWVIIAVCLAIAFAAASQDIVIDAFAVDILHPEEQGVAVGARTAVYRVAMFVSGGLAITLVRWFTWPQVCAALALLYLPTLYVTWVAPEAERHIPTPSTLREAVWSVDIRLPADFLQHRLHPPGAKRRQPAPDVRGDELRERCQGNGHGRVRRTASADDAEALLGNPVCVVLEHVRVAPARDRSGDGVSGACRRLDPVLLVHDGDGHTRHGDVGPIRSSRIEGARVRGRATEDA